jgi:hypothetical protein
VTEPLGPGFVHGELSPGEVLEALARLGDALPPLQQRGLKIVKLPAGPLGTYAGIFVPDAGGQDVAERKLREVLQEMRPDSAPRPMSLRPEQVMPLQPALLWLLISSCSETDSVQPVAGEWLVVASGLDQEQAARLAEDLRFHATAMHLAPTRERSGNQLFLFHLCADTRRKSSFHSFVTGGGLQGGELLAAFDCQGQLIFLPAEHAPSRRALAAFRRVVTGTPRLLGVRQLEPDASGRLLAIALRKIEGRLRANLLLLSQVAFVDQMKAAPPAAPYIDLDVQALQADEPALEALRRAVAGSEPRVGYRLELRHTTRSQGSDRELRRLSERIADLQHRLSYARSLQRSYPVLLRFSQRQLPALADAVRCFPMQTLNQGLVSYGFQASGATSGSAGGWHFLLYDATDARMEEPYPPWRWRELGDETRFFQLDPFWAEHCFAQGTTSMVFVPQGMTLFPTLHAWAPEEIDRHLLRTVSEWFPGCSETFAGLQQPIYVFDGAPEPDASIHLQVLDRAQLRPLVEKIGWINDHLVLHRAVADAEQLISALAADISQHELAREMRGRARASREAFRETAQQVHRALSAEASELMTVMTEEIAEIARRCREGEARIAELLTALEQMEEAIKSVAATPGQVERVVTSTDKAAARRLQVLAEIERKLIRGSARRDALVKRCAGEIDQLHEAEAELHRRLQQPRRRRG